jgi:hypothetical protein
MYVSFYRTNNDFFDSRLSAQIKAGCDGLCHIRRSQESIRRKLFSFPHIGKRSTGRYESNSNAIIQQFVPQVDRKGTESGFSDAIAGHHEVRFIRDGEVNCEYLLLDAVPKIIFMLPSLYSLFYV